MRTYELFSVFLDSRVLTAIGGGQWHALVVWAASDVELLKTRAPADVEGPRRGGADEGPGVRALVHALPANVLVLT